MIPYDIEVKIGIYSFNINKNVMNLLNKFQNIQINCLLLGVE